MRVLLVSDFYPPYLGGVELQVEALAHALAARGHDVHVATVAQAGLPGRSRDGAVTIHRLPALATRTPWFSGDGRRRYHPPFPDPELALRLRRLVARVRPDVVQAHGWIAYSCALAGVGQRAPLVLSVRDYGYTCPTRSLLLDGRICSGPEAIKCLRHSPRWYGPAKGIAAYAGVFLGRPLLRQRVAAVHVVSRYVAQVVRRDLLGADRRQLVTIPDIVLAARDRAGGPAAGGSNSAAELHEPAVAAALARLPARPFILFVGALQLHKGIGVLLDAYGRLADPPPLVLIGTSWPDTPKAFPDGVTVIADAPHAAVMAAWEGATFGVAPSIWPDPLPGVVREAMIAGRPVVGSAVGGIVDMISDGETGLLVPPADAPALAAAMRRLIEEPDLAERLGAAARDSAREFDADHVASRFEALYQDVARIPPAAGWRARTADGRGERPRRIHITGGSGTGKSSLAVRLATMLGLPTYHLDELARETATGIRRPVEERRALVHDIAERPEWITEGIHVGWTDELFREAEVVVWLDHVGWREAVTRVSRRFLAGWTTETRRRGLRHVFRPRQYLRHLLEFVRAVGEIRRYRTLDGAIVDASTIDDAGSHLATLEQVAPYAAKLVHCRRAEDVGTLLSTLVALPARSQDPGGRPSERAARTGATVR